MDGQVELSEIQALKIQLLSQEMTNLKLMLQLKSQELEAVKQDIEKEYSEDGKYRVRRVDLESRTVFREPVESDEQSKAVHSKA